METSEAVEARIREKVEWLEKSYDRLIGCHVVVEQPHQHGRKGGLFHVTVEMRVPGGDPIVAGKAHHDQHGHEDVYVAIRDTFDAARRLLGDHRDKQNAHA
jgi:ribosome-associated translation inhibitor RaiA